MFYVIIYVILAIMERKAILLVGGFSASPWLYSRLDAHLKKRGVKFYRPDDHV
jgi:hypothetical protein